MYFRQIQCPGERANRFAVQFCSWGSPTQKTKEVKILRFKLLISPCAEIDKNAFINYFKLIVNRVQYNLKGLKHGCACLYSCTRSIICFK